MKVVGLTGGIGSGKSTVAKFFEELEIPVYIADVEAKRITNTSKVVRRKVCALLGEESYTEEGINRNYVSNKIFNNKELLAKVNAIIHPKVKQHFIRWTKKQHAPYCIKEAAILIENGSYKDCDYIILVTAPQQIRIQRTIARDSSTKEQIQSRIDNQWTDAQKEPFADFIINNLDLKETKKQVHKIHKSIINS